MNSLYKIITFSLLLVCISTANAESFFNFLSHNAATNEVQIRAQLSQSKLVQQGANTVFLDVHLTPPKLNTPKQATQRATDFIIILDRSGSMSEAKKMAYAKAAIWDVLAQLHEHDRFSLVSFADHASIQSPLVNVNSANRGHLNQLVSNIHPAGGTNMGDGLQTALRLLANNPLERTRKILLLSDGQANKGITNPKQLAQLVTQATHYGAVLSTIGMGLGFNETLMAKLADVGMGNYTYLEDLSGLSAIIARDLHDTRNIYASSSYLDINLSNGIQLMDAAGYPITHLGGSLIRVTTGQLLSHTEKHFVMTFTVPTQHIGSISLAALQLNYQVQDQQHQVQSNPEHLQVTVVAPEQRIQAQQSINKEVYQKSWAENNLGIMQKKLSRWLREGKKDQAKQAITEYRQEMEAAATTSKLPLASPKVTKQLEKMEEDVDDAFDGSLQDQQIKRNRAAKSMQYESISSQRK